MFSRAFSGLGPFLPPFFLGFGAGSSSSSLDDSLSLHSSFSMAVTGKYLEFDAKFDADKEDNDDKEE